MLRGAGARRSHSCHSRGRAGQAGASVAQAPPRRALQVRSGRRAGAAPAFVVENDRARLRLPGSSPAAAGAGSGRAETRGGDRPRAASELAGCPHECPPGRADETGLPVRIPREPGAPARGPADAGASGGCSCALPNQRLEIKGPRRRSHRSRLAQLTCHLATQLDLRVRTELATGGTSDPETPVNTAAPSHRL